MLQCSELTLPYSLSRVLLPSAWFLHSIILQLLKELWELKSLRFIDKAELAWIQVTETGNMKHTSLYFVRESGTFNQLLFIWCVWHKSYTAKSYVSECGNVIFRDSGEENFQNFPLSITNLSKSRFGNLSLI